jgi:hypothetical protein
MIKHIAIQNQLDGVKVQWMVACCALREEIESLRDPYSGKSLQTFYACFALPGYQALTVPETFIPGKLPPDA